MEAKQEVGWQGVSGSTLKLLAVITMLIDHIAAAVIVRMLRTGRGSQELLDMYYIMRDIGRFAFPVYCFMLVEGLERTRSKWKYAARLGIFALVSEIPFDLAFSSKVLEFGYQNVYFTLAVGLVTLIVIERIESGKIWRTASVKASLLKSVLTVLVSAGGMALAALLRTDYGWMGVTCILILYFLRRGRIWQLIAGYAAFVLLLGEFAALPAFVLLALYRGKKGFSGKWFFYGFYPVHLILLYLTCVLMGIAYIPAI